MAMRAGIRFLELGNSQKHRRPAVSHLVMGPQGIAQQTKQLLRAPEPRFVPPYHLRNLSSLSLKQMLVTPIQSSSSGFMMPTSYSSFLDT